jgi:hypothetical protein
MVSKAFSRADAVRVAHAPDASVTAADSRADCDTGRKQRRPIDSGEIADREELATSPADEITFLSRPLMSELPRAKGDHTSRACGPPVFSSLSRILPMSRGKEVGF